jgi:hypothetical protein
MILYGLLQLHGKLLPLTEKSLEKVLHHNAAELALLQISRQLPATF